MVGILDFTRTHHLVRLCAWEAIVMVQKDSGVIGSIFLFYNLECTGFVRLITAVMFFDYEFVLYRSFNLQVSRHGCQFDDCTHDGDTR